MSNLHTTLVDHLSRWLRHDDRGASLVEYALLMAFIALVCVAAIGVIGQETATPFSSAGSGFSN